MLLLHLSWTFIGRFGGQGPAFESSTGRGGICTFGLHSRRCRMTDSVQVPIGLLRNSLLLDLHSEKGDVPGRRLPVPCRCFVLANRHGRALRVHSVPRRCKKAANT